MIKANYHTHTFRCGHAEGSEDDYVKSAIDNDVNILGFSDHGPFKDVKYDFRMDYSDLDSYIFEIDKLKDSYKDQVKILSGVEIEFFENEMKFYEELYTKKHLDYLLLGQHMWDKNGKILFGGDAKSSDDLIYYGNALCKAMDSKLFKVIGHPDFYMRFPYPVDYNIEKITDSIINSAVKNNSILEFNANGIRCGLQDINNENRYMYPCKYFWDNVKNTEVKIVINSDCHNPKDLWDKNMAKAFELAKKWRLSSNLTNKI